MYFLHAIATRLASSSNGRFGEGRFGEVGRDGYTGGLYQRDRPSSNLVSGSCSSSLGPSICCARFFGVQNLAACISGQVVGAVVPNRSVTNLDEFPNCNKARFIEYSSGLRWEMDRGKLGRRGHSMAECCCLIEG